MIRRVTTDKNYLYLTSRIVFKEKYIYKYRLVDKWGPGRGAGGGQGEGGIPVPGNAVCILFISSERVGIF